MTGSAYSCCKQSINHTASSKRWVLSPLSSSVSSYLSSSDWLEKQDRIDFTADSWTHAAENSAYFVQVLGIQKNPKSPYKLCPMAKIWTNTSDFSDICNQLFKQPGEWYVCTEILIAISNPNTVLK